jgi:hypothetical protein
MGVRTRGLDIAINAKRQVLGLHALPPAAKAAASNL